MQWDETEKYREIKTRADVFNDRLPQWVIDANEKTYQNAIEEARKHPHLRYWHTMIAHWIFIIRNKIKSIF
jgi:hypothetical protein